MPGRARESHQRPRMKLTPVLCALVLAAGCRSSAPAPEAAAGIEWLERTDRVQRLSCYRGDTFGSRYGLSVPVSTPDGSVRAWSEVWAIAYQPGDAATRACRSISRLWVQERGGEPRLVFEQNPGAEGKNGNSIVPVAWSNDGRLLFQLDTWTYYTDREIPIIAIWRRDEPDVQILQLEVQRPAELKEACSSSLQAVGFSPSGEVRVRTEPMAGPDAPLPPCERAAGEWIVAADGTLRAGS